MLTCSLKETCKIWAEFLDCLYKRNSFGGITCEIYSYRLQEYNPALHATHLHFDLIEEQRREGYQAAARSLIYLLTEFCREYGCTSEIDSMDIGKWAEEVGAPGHFNHRCHITIIDTEAQKC